MPRIPPAPELTLSTTASSWRVSLDGWRWASRAGVATLCALALRFGTDAGVIWDEWAQRTYGDLVLAWYRSGFRDRSALGFMNLYLYGGLFDAPAQILCAISPLGPYETRHALSVALALIGVVVTAKIATRIGGARAGFFAGMLLALTPAWVGHGLFNPKDIPFATAVACVCYASVSVLLARPPLSWHRALFAMTCVGLALGVRPGGMFLFAYPLAAVGARGLLDLRNARAPGTPSGAWRSVAASFLRLLSAAPLAWALMLAFWPWAQLSPFVRPFLAAREAMRFTWKQRVLFDGEFLLSSQLPRSYLPTWFAITLPETFLFAAVAGAIALLFRLSRGARLRLEPRVLALGFLAVAALGPLLAAMLTRPILYDAQRHFLFLLPALAALCGVALSAAFEALPESRSRGLFAAAFCACAALTALDMAELHPYEYTYFNRPFGGLRHAANRFETDYWGASYAEGLRWLVAHVRPQPDPQRRLRVGTCSEPAQIEYYLARWPRAAERLRLVEDMAEADVLLATTRFDCHKRDGVVLHRIERQHVPLLYVIALAHRAPQPAPASELAARNLPRR